MVMYDSASRGPIGSRSLLCNLGLRHPLSSFGAINTILRLANDPFAQQIIRYYSCTLISDDYSSNVPRTNLYVFPSYYGSPGGSNHLGFGGISIDPELRSAINSGIFSPGSHVAPNCLTGSCSLLQPYSTVGYCGRFTDITITLKFRYENGSSLGPRSIPFDEGSGSTSGSSSAHSSILSYLPSGTSINSSAPYDPLDRLKRATHMET